MDTTKLILIWINKLFPLPIHPFNLQKDRKKSYAMWQFEKGLETIEFYLPYTTVEEIFKNKVVLDIGCGAGGKSIFYAKQGVNILYGIDLIDGYKEQAEALAREKNLDNKFKFIIGDATKLPFKDNFFDTIILNDSMEHVNNPEKVLKECYRTLKKGGKVYINFPPYNHPFGIHLSDVIGIPWVHLFFSNRTLIDAYKELVKNLPDGKERVGFRISKDNNDKEYFSYINGMTIKRFEKLIYKSNLKRVYYKIVPLRKIIAPLSKLPLLREFFTKMVVYIGEKSLVR